MKILVCIKQVPGSNNVEVDPVTGVLKRNGIKSKMNPYDLYAIETALFELLKVGCELFFVEDCVNGCQAEFSSAQQMAQLVKAVHRTWGVLHHNVYGVLLAQFVEQSLRFGLTAVDDDIY